mgnify:CR=1 FL=1
MKSNIVIFGCSAGGSRALDEIIPHLDLHNTVILIVSHSPEYITGSLASHLNKLSHCGCKVAEERLKVEPNNLYLAPGGKHLKLLPGGYFSLLDTDPINFVKPNIDLIMTSLDKSDFNSIVSIILSGMGRDGTQGTSYLKSIGATTIAQDKESSSVFGMPGSVIKSGKIDFIMSPTQINSFLNKKFS